MGATLNLVATSCVRRQPVLAYLRSRATRRELEIDILTRA
jgi:hypothetical protein